jgi:hypothetical protein
MKVDGKGGSAIAAVHLSESDEMKGESCRRRALGLVLVSALLIAWSSPRCFASKPEGPNRRATHVAPIRVGVFNGRGTSPECVLETYEALLIDGDIRPSYVGAIDIALGKLNDLDALVFPGGSGSKEYNNLGLALAGPISDFVRKEGKGVVGICAGAYLLSDTDGYPCLHLIDAEAVDREHDERGAALAEVAFTENGLSVFPEMKGYRYGYIEYHDGPLFVPSKRQTLPAYEELATIRSDIHLTGDAPAGMSPGKPMLLREEAGRGRVFACAGHPEGTAGMRWIVPRMVRWASRRELVSYESNVVKPSLNDREIMHGDSLETELFWKLFDPNPGARMGALEKLVERRYRNGTRWAVGMLRDTDPNVRSLAGQVLVENEYTAAIPDLDVAIRTEKNDWCRINLQAYRLHMKQLYSSNLRLDRTVERPGPSRQP